MRLGRRTFVQGMMMVCAGEALSSALPWQNHSTTGKDKSDRVDGAPTNPLYVVVHGTWILSFDKTGVSLLAPKVDIHRYRAGNWAAERELKEPYDTYEISPKQVLGNSPLPATKLAQVGM